MYVKKEDIYWNQFNALMLTDTKPEIAKKKLLWSSWLPNNIPEEWNMNNDKAFNKMLRWPNERKNIRRTKGQKIS